MADITISIYSEYCARLFMFDHAGSKEHDNNNQVKIRVSMEVYHLSLGLTEANNQIKEQLVHHGQAIS